MAETQSATDKYVGQVRSFTLPPEFSNKPEAPKEPPAAPPPAEAKPATEAVATPPEVASQTDDDPDKETTGTDPEKQSSRRFERRIDRATKRAAEAQARAELLERRLAELEAQKRPPEPGEPKMDQFTDIEEYAKAREKWGANRALREHQTKQRQAQQQAAVKKLTQDWEAKSSRGMQKYDDFDEIVGELKPQSAWAVAVMEEDNGDEIAYYLGKHLKEMHKIAALTPAGQIREIAKLSIKLAATPEAPKKASKAPPPINPVTEPAAPSGELRENMPFEEYRKWGNKTFRGR